MREVVIKSNSPQVCCNPILDQVLCALQSVLAPNYELYKDDRAKASYTVPAGNEIEGYRKAIEELPGQENPGIFGLHANADLTFRSLQVQAGVQLILDIQPAGIKAAGGASKEDVVDQICEDLLAKARHLPAASISRRDGW